MTSAFLFINAELLFVEDIINELKQIPEIVAIFKVQGTYDSQKMMLAYLLLIKIKIHVFLWYATYLC
jgi:hypothetical protein